MICDKNLNRRMVNGLDFWGEVHGEMKLLVARECMSGVDRYRGYPKEDLSTYLLRSTDAEFLDFIEKIFRTHAYGFRFGTATKLIDDLNYLFQVDDLPYLITDFVREPGTTYYNGIKLVGPDILVSYPKVIRRDDDITHVHAVAPSLALLRDKHFHSANTEFLDALEDFRKGDHGDCLTKCCSAFESTMKIICDRKGWAYDQKDPAGKLIATVMLETGLAPFFKDPLTMIATIRNRLSNSHGAGAETRDVPEHVAKRLSRNSSAS
jgi:hypothetical protein